MFNFSFFKIIPIGDSSTEAVEKQFAGNRIYSHRITLISTGHHFGQILKTIIASRNEKSRFIDIAVILSQKQGILAHGKTNRPETSLTILIASSETGSYLISIDNPQSLIIGCPFLITFQYINHPFVIDRHIMRTIITGRLITATQTHSIQRFPVTGPAISGDILLYLITKFRFTGIFPHRSFCSNLHINPSGIRTGSNNGINMISVTSDNGGFPAAFSYHNLNKFLFCSKIPTTNDQLSTRPPGIRTETGYLYGYPGIKNHFCLVILTISQKQCH